MSGRRRTTEAGEAARGRPGPSSTTSAAQDREWFAAELAPEQSPNALCRAYRVHGDLDVAALRSAWEAVLDRHESLRSTIVTRAGRPVQRIATTAVGGAFSCTDRTAAPASEHARFVTDLATSPIRLSEGPLARLHLARFAADDHVVLLVAHRVCCDEDSLAIVVRELSEAYAAVTNGVSPDAAWPAAPPRYADYAQRDSRRLADPPAVPPAALTPPPPPLELPADRARPPGPSFDAGVLHFDWGAEIHGAPARGSVAGDTAPPTILLAAFQTLLHRYTGEDRVTVGTPVSVRPPEFDGTVGTFENVLVLCTDFRERPAFSEVLGRLATVRQEAARHRDLPFHHLVRTLPIPRDPRRVPLCDALVAIGDGFGPELLLTGTSVRPLPLEAGYARADLALTVHATASHTRGSLEYRDSLFTRSSARTVLTHLRTLVAAALTEPGTPVDDLPLEGRELARTAVREADRRAAGPPGAEPVTDLVHRAGTRSPHATALSRGGVTVSYRDLRRHAARITAALPAGVAGSPVAIRMPTGPRQTAASLAVLDAGAHLVCLGAGDTGERGRTVLADLRPTCLLLDGPSTDDALARWYTGELGGRVLDVAALPEGGPDLTAPAGPGPGDRAYVAYTSGSTGQPKGIPHTHGTFAQFVTWFSTEFGIAPGARVAQWAAPGYDASLCEVFAALTAGATVCPVPDRIRANPDKIVDWLSDERITHFQTVPSFARELLAVLDERGGPDRLNELGHLLLAGEPLPGDLVRAVRTALPSVRLINLYGPTELILATWHEVSDDGLATAPIGEPIPGRQVLVLDDHDRACPAGVVGNLIVRGPHITQGYLGGGRSDREPFRPLTDVDGHGIGGACYRTGDLGRRRFDGALEYRGRKDFQVKFNGVRLELSDIEAALAAHDSVAECAIVATVGADGLVAGLTADVLPRRAAGEGEAGTPATWRRHLRARFGDAMPPVSFRTRTDLPRTVGGKIDRRRLPAGGPPGHDPARAPHTAVETEIAAIWADLGAEPATVDDTFAAAGGHSLLVPRVLHALRERFGVDCPLWDVVTHSTVAGLAALVESHGGHRGELHTERVPRSTREDVPRGAGCDDHERDHQE